MFRQNELEAADSQRARLCTGLILLMLSMMLALTQDSKTSTQEPLNRRPADFKRPTWIHSSPPCQPSISRIAFFNLQQDKPLLSHFISLPLKNHTNLSSSANFYSNVDSLSGQGHWSSSVRNLSPFAPSDDLLYCPPSRSRSQSASYMAQVVAVYGPASPCIRGGDSSEVGSCFIGLEALGKKDCEKALWMSKSDPEISSLSRLYDCPSSDMKVRNCFRLLYSKTLSGLNEASKQIGTDSHFGRPFCSLLEPTSLSFDQINQELYFVTREAPLDPTAQKLTDRNLQQNPEAPEDSPLDRRNLQTSSFDSKWENLLWRVSLRNGAIFKDAISLAEPDEPRMTQSVLQSSLINNRLGHSIAASHQWTDDNTFVKSRIPFNQSNYISTTRPFLIFPASTGTFVSVLRSIGDHRKDLIATIYKRLQQPPFLQLVQSVQMDSLSLGYVIDSPMSSAGEYLLIMGSAPPYSWQVQAIDLNRGGVESRHSYVL